MRTRVLLAALLLTLGEAPSAARETGFNRGWKFALGDPQGAPQLTFDDVDWETVRTPHDWAIRGPFDPKVDGHAGKLPWRGVGWYRKWLMLDRREEGSRVYLDFDGVMASPRVYINGKLAGEWDYGYTPFRVDVTDHVRFGRANVVAVRVDTTRMKTRWYPGAGIFRKVGLVVSPPAHLSHFGSRVTTRQLTKEGATIMVRNSLENHQPIARSATVRVRLLSPGGNELESLEQTAEIEPMGKATVRHEFRVSAPERWDVDSPRLYTAVSELLILGKLVDARRTHFGIREARFTADDGFRLNGRRVDIQGVNLHHDLGVLGSAFNRRAAERQLLLLKEMGVNAIRTAHNPPAAEVLDLCDQHGLLVWDELFDKWGETAGRINGEPPFGQYVRRHAAQLVKRDRNHPCVIVWSAGNEIINQPHDPEGKSRERLRIARAAFREHDKTRPVAIGCFIPSTANSDTLADLDIAGWNYQERYKLFRQRFKDTPIVYSESASAISSRGWSRLPLPTTKCDYSPEWQVNAFELNAAPWADLPEVEFERLRRDRYVAGEFVWTGFDYLGEPTPFEAHARSSYFGIFDLVGLPKDRYYLYRSLWRPDAATVHIGPHWNWEGREGQPIPVMVYTNGDSAELYLNGRSVGRRRKGEGPPALTDLAAGAAVSASSQTPDAPPARLANKGRSNEGNAWRASPADDKPWCAVDMGRVQRVRTVVLRFPRETKLYSLNLRASAEGENWTTLAEKTAKLVPRWGGVHELIFRVDAEARHLRVDFGDCLEGATPSLVGFSVYSGEYESEYFRPTYNYRLRWNAVAYEAGELRAVAYKDGAVIGEAVVRTAGPPARLALTADRSQLATTGDDLAFVTISALDAKGTPCPLAQNNLTLTVSGPGELAGADAGNPLSLDPLQDDRVALFHGKAVAVIRADEGLGGPIDLKVESGSLPTARIRLEAK